MAVWEENLKMKIYLCKLGNDRNTQYIPLDWLQIISEKSNVNHCVNFFFTFHFCPAEDKSRYEMQTYSPSRVTSAGWRIRVSL